MSMSDGQVLVKTYTFDTFSDTMRFINAVGDIAEQQNHHPTMLVQYLHCTLRYTTHDAGNRVTQKDVNAVESIENWYASHSA